VSAFDPFGSESSKLIYKGVDVSILVRRFRDKVGRVFVS